MTQESERLRRGLNVITKDYGLTVMYDGTASEAREKGTWVAMWDAIELSKVA